VVISSPFCCFPHRVGFINEAGFLDHLHSTHRLSTGQSFCSGAGSSCIFFGH
jgi:hypothetical protein